MRFAGDGIATTRFETARWHRAAPRPGSKVSEPEVRHERPKAGQAEAMSERSQRDLPDQSGAQVVDLFDALLENADRLLNSAIAVLEVEDVALARSLAILGLEESAKAIAIFNRRVQIAYAPEGEAFVDDRLRKLWADHQAKLDLAHDFLAEELYWFDVEAPDPDANREYLGTIKSWTRRHNKFKKRGFYVDIDKSGSPLTPSKGAEAGPVAEVIEHVHQIGWQLRLGEHIEAKKQAERLLGSPASSDAEIDEMRRSLEGFDSTDDQFVDRLLTAMKVSVPGTPLNNDEYRLHLPSPDVSPFANLDKPGYEAQARELQRMAEKLDQQ